MLAIGTIEELVQHLECRVALAALVDVFVRFTFLFLDAYLARLCGDDVLAILDADAGQRIQRERTKFLKCDCRVRTRENVLIEERPVIPATGFCARRRNRRDHNTRAEVSCQVGFLFAVRLWAQQMSDGQNWANDGGIGRHARKLTYNHFLNKSGAMGSCCTTHPHVSQVRFIFLIWASYFNLQPALPQAGQRLCVDIRGNSGALFILESDPARTSDLLLACANQTPPRNSCNAKSARASRWLASRTHCNAPSAPRSLL